MSDLAELAAVLGRVGELLARADLNTIWSSYTADELRDEVARLLARAESGEPLAGSERQLARYLFLPTGPLQETAVSSGWGDEFLGLARRADAAI